MADFQSNIKFIKGWEGGLSRALTDTAHKNPCPCPYNGQTGWHTNKGVTWSAFLTLGPQLGYDPSCDNFFAMPDDIWQKIYRFGYWAPMQGDLYKSQAIANNVAEIAWGSGVGGDTRVMKDFLKKYYNIVVSTPLQIVQAINKLTEKTDKDVFTKLIEHRANFYKSLNQPANIKGWLARLDQLRQKSLALLYENKVAVGGGLLFFFTLGRSLLEA
jgi:lysozyme family protein